MGHTIDHRHYMTEALLLAKQGECTVSPNPMVGCLLVNNGQIVGQGFHEKAGGPHAEIIALEQASVLAKNSTAYVTLEPCCHHGRTPPCTDALIKAGIKKVYIACQDPNPLVKGKGIESLRKAGIGIEIGINEQEAIALNKVFFHYIAHRRPFVMAKWAMSLDGKTITHPEDSQQISSPESQQATHQLRQRVDAILVGANTAVNDNPLLTVRLATQTSPKQPLRIVLSTKGTLPLDLNLFSTTLPGKTIVATTEESSVSWREQLTQKNIPVLLLPKNSTGNVDLHALLDELGRMQITSLLVEGGMSVHESFFNENLVNDIHVYIAPTIIGKLKNKKIASSLNIKRLSRDIYLTTSLKGLDYV